MNINDRNSLAGILSASRKSGDTGIKSRGLSQVSSDAIRGELPAWVNPCHYDYVQGVPKQQKPAEWTSFDTFLSKKLGFRVNYEQERGFSLTKEKVVEKSISRYSSSLANQGIKRHKADFSEADLLKGINIVETDCDLKNTTVAALPDLKEVKCNLSLDASSPLKDLSNLKKIGGKLRVFAKNQEEMQAYLKQLGLMSKDGSLLASIGEKLTFVMKTHL